MIYDLSIIDLDKYTVLCGTKDIYAMGPDMANRYKVPPLGTEYRKIRTPHRTIELTGWVADNPKYLHNVPYHMVGDRIVTVREAIAMGAILFPY